MLVPERHRLVGPRRPAQLPGQHVGDVDLDNDLAVEVVARVQIEVGVRVAGEAVDTAVTAAAIRIDRPVEGQRAAFGTWLSADLANTSWKVMPANSGVRTTRTGCSADPAPAEPPDRVTASLETS